MNVQTPGKTYIEKLSVFSRNKDGSFCSYLLWNMHRGLSERTQIWEVEEKYHLCYQSESYVNSIKGTHIFLTSSKVADCFNPLGDHLLALAQDFWLHLRMLSAKDSNKKCVREYHFAKCVHIICDHVIFVTSISNTVHYNYAF